MTKRKPKELHKKRGRPPVITAEILAQLKLAFAIGATDVEALAFVAKKGIPVPERTFYDYCKAHPVFSHEKEQLKKNPILIAKDTVYKNLSKDPKVAMWYLEKKCKEEFGNQPHTLNVSGRVDAVVTAEDDIKTMISEIIELNKIKGIELTEEQFFNQIKEEDVKAISEEDS